MEEAPESGKESSHSAHANGMNEWIACNGNDIQKRIWNVMITLNTDTALSLFGLLVSTIMDMQKSFLGILQFYHWMHNY